MNDFILKIDGHDYNASVNSGQNKVVIDGKDYEVDMLQRLGVNIFSFVVNNKVCHFEVNAQDGGLSSIVMDGFSFDIEVTDETKRLLNEFLKQSGGGSNNGNSVLKAPMPGMVVRIMAEEGQTVKAGDKLVIVEAMKMENALVAPVDAVIKSIAVGQGQAVDKNQLLMEFDPIA